MYLIIGFIFGLMAILIFASLLYMICIDSTKLNYWSCINFLSYKTSIEVVDISMYFTS